jgi:hypothetical protein
MPDQPEAHKPAVTGVLGGLALSAVVVACGPDQPISEAKGLWTGTVSLGSESVGLQLDLVDGQSGAVSGEVRFQDPESKAWVSAGPISGRLGSAQAADGALKLAADSGPMFDLLGKNNALNGTATMPDQQDTVSGVVAAIRS